MDASAMTASFDQRTQLKMRRTVHSNPQEDIDIECSSSSFEDVKKDDYANNAGAANSRFSELTPLSRRIARFVSPLDNNPYLEAIARLVPPLAVLLLLPQLLWDVYDYSEPWSLARIVRNADLAWTALLHISSRPIAAVTLLTVVMLPRGGFKHKSFSGGFLSSLGSAVANVSQSSWKMSLTLSFILLHTVIFQMALQMGYPSLLWNPFMWGWYKVHLPQDIGSALSGACFEDLAARQPLCLQEWQWKELSSGTLSSSNPDDVLAVQRGYQYLQNNSGGILINALARNVVDAIPALRQNMEGLSPLVKDDKLALVVFENDSTDGTREAFKQWASEKNLGYSVDLMECGPNNPDCQLNIMDRYDSNLFTNPKASGVGKLGEFRQVLLEYILSQPKYEEYSHMIVLDVDLGTSLSPLGLLHTLGLKGDLAESSVVASSSSQVWPGTMGSIIPPYDLSAFRAEESESTRRARELHKSFCELMPKGDRWRNMCEACSPMQLFLIQSADDPSNHNGQPYPVTSAFNGLTLYPMSLIRSRGPLARYDSGDDNQRCEHVGFHLSLSDVMYVNPKWTMHLKPDKPGGPTGIRAIKTLVYAVFGRPNVMFAIVCGNLFFFYVFVAAFWAIGSVFKSVVLR
ncbi:hypothetical protein HJC23_010293 [Cyclotella cryptica]|uniref:Uncharacterized protein n=1 Tax=Cyclotella cryptica TaxID=29204 RepID=A0ABD3QP12_9STRA|eukprot:CCRYP_003687-RA/>CCRYP_003687-RA protein AED:0.02 eAED:0.02 QI:269/1/1/1/1/1/2/530/630